MASGTFLVLLIVGLLFLARPAHAFGAGNIPSISYLEGKAFRHGDLEDVLETLLRKSGAGAGLLGMVGIGGKFGGLDVKRVYFGNWLRDYSQAMDVAGLSKLSVQAIINVCMVLGFLAHGFATGEFEVTEERLGVYLPVEHIDNPKGYAVDLPGQDARAIHPKLRPPVMPYETEIDPQTGMKNYIANERDGRFDTSAACIRRTMLRCIEMGRRARSTGSSNDLYEAYRLLGQFLHTLEDLPAHSNWVELTLLKMGHRQVFTHVGDQVKVQSPGGPVAPLVTGTFGGSDFIHSLLGEATDHISEASVTDLQKKIDDARNAPQDKAADGLREMLFQIPGANGQQLSREMDDCSNLSRGPIDPANMSPQELHATLWRILKFRDDVSKAITRGIEKVPGLGSLIERFGDAISRWVFLTIEPWVKPLMAQATTALGQGSSAVLANNADQYAVFDDPYASDPTHSFISKDHFNGILNEPAGKVALVIVKHAVKDVVNAWDNPSTDPHAIINNTLLAIHHPFFADSRIPIHNEMYQVVEKWFQEERDKNYVLNALTKDSVRNHRNNRKGTKTDYDHHQSFLPTPQQVGGQAQQKISTFANQVAQSVPGYSTYQNMMSRDGTYAEPSFPGGYHQGNSGASYPAASPQPSYDTPQHQGYGHAPQQPQQHGYGHSPAPYGAPTGFPEPQIPQPGQWAPPAAAGDFYGQGPPPGQMPMPMAMPGHGFNEPYPPAQYGQGYGHPQPPHHQGYNPNY